jgi:hypothetical protein
VGAKLLQMEALVSFTFRRKEICFWWPALLKHTTVRNFQIEASQVIALEEVIEVAW